MTIKTRGVSAPWWRSLLALFCFLAAALPSSHAADNSRCLLDAAKRFRVPASLIQAIMDVEGGTQGRVSYNTNGSYDIGPMQINSIWLPDVEKRGGSLQLLLYHSCANIHFGTWLLSRELGGIDTNRIDVRSFWRAVGNYHSRTPERNAGYSQKVWLAWRKRLAGNQQPENLARLPESGQLARGQSAR